MFFVLLRSSPLSLTAGEEEGSCSRAERTRGRYTRKRCISDVSQTVQTKCIRVGGKSGKEQMVEVPVSP